MSSYSLFCCLWLFTVKERLKNKFLTPASWIGHFSLSLACSFCPCSAFSSILKPELSRKNPANHIMCTYKNL